MEPTLVLLKIDAEFSQALSQLLSALALNFCLLVSCFRLLLSCFRLSLRNFRMLPSFIALLSQLGRSQKRLFIRSINF